MPSEASAKEGFLDALSQIWIGTRIREQAPMVVRGPIICLEGPSAVGKSTVARCLADNHNYVIIPEVNELFRNEKRNGDDWYLQRQIDRYTRSIAAATSGRAVVLDGDPFQPLWYNWIYPEYGSWMKVAAFYRAAMETGSIAFPEFYAILQTPIERLMARKTGDVTRRRHNFDRHLRLIPAQRRYFEHLNTQGCIKVEFIQNVNAPDTAFRIAALARTGTATPKSARLLSTISAWLNENCLEQESLSDIANDES